MHTLHILDSVAVSLDQIRAALIYLVIGVYVIWLIHSLRHRD